MVEIHGTSDARLAPVRDVLAEELEHGEELGASIVVDVGGETLLDVWGGWRDQARTTPWTEDTIVNVWSTTKTVTSLAAQAPWWEPGTVVPGIIGSDRSEAYVRAIHECLG